MSFLVKRQEHDLKKKGGKMGPFCQPKHGVKESTTVRGVPITVLLYYLPHILILKQNFSYLIHTSGNSQTFDVAEWAGKLKNGNIITASTTLEWVRDSQVRLGMPQRLYPQQYLKLSKALSSSLINFEARAGISKSKA